MSQGVHPKRILVADDEEDVQILVCRILADAGYEVESASDGAEALRKITERRPDLLILDLMMPGLDGWEVLDRLRSAGNAPPVVVLTARDDYRSFARGFQGGPAAYVCKPFRFDELVAICQRVLLAAAASPEAIVPERRKVQRRVFLVEVQVLSRDRAPLALGEMVNLSDSGAQVDLRFALDLGVRVRVALHFSNSSAPLSLAGFVRWREPSSRGFSHGLAFEALSADEERQLRDLLGPAP